MPYKRGLFSFAGFAWALWKVRNKMAIEKRFPTNPLEVIRSEIVFVHKWCPLLKEVDRGMVNKALDKMQAFLGGYRLSGGALSDIFELLAPYFSS
jgi:hypothetical protein